MSRILLFASLSLCSICASAQSPDENRTYGHPGQSGSSPAAPSTLPGRGDSNARVPEVRPAPGVQPKPRKPGAPASPWGGSAGMQTPNTMPMPNKPATPPASSQPPVAQNGGGGPTTSTTPGASTPPPSQPQAGANDRLASAYRGLGSTSTAIRGSGAAPIKGGTATAGTASLSSAALACAKNGDTPTIRAVRPANDVALQSGQAFILEGLCFGDARGTVRVTLPTQYGRIQAHEAKVLDWQGGKILAQLPDGIVKATPGDASVEVVSVPGRRGTKDVAFDPRWELVAVAGKGRILDCAKGAKSALGNDTMESCEMGDARVETPGFGMPTNARNGSGSDTWGTNVDIHEDATFGGRFYTPEDIDKGKANLGRARFEIELPAFARLSGCQVSTQAFETVRGTRDASASVSLAGNVATMDYRLNGTGTRGWLVASVHCKAWAPVGLVAK